MRWCLLFSVVAIVSAAAPALASDEQDCFQGKEPEIRIKGCTEIIQRSPKDATAYHNRAVAYGQAGDIDSAIVDFTKAIEIAPNNASAYENRGRAYASKGDNAQAAADETKANELLAKATAQPTASTAKKSTSQDGHYKGYDDPAEAQSANPTANNNAGKEASGTSWWSWLYGTDQAKEKKNVKP